MLRSNRLNSYYLQFHQSSVDRNWTLIQRLNSVDAENLPNITEFSLQRNIHENILVISPIRIGICRSESNSFSVVEIPFNRRG